MENKLILYSQADGIATVTLNNPSTKNSLLFPLLAELQEVFQQASDDPAVRCVVLQGAEGNFSSGGNVKSMQDPAMRIVNGESIEGEAIIDLFSSSVWAVRKCKKPVIARLEGVVAGAAISLALACDFRYAAKNTRFVCAFSKVGLLADSGLLSLLKCLVGYQTATEIAMTAGTLSTDDALRLGIVTEVVDDDHLDGAVQQAASELAQGPTLAYAASKHVMNVLLEQDFRCCVAAEKHLIPILRGSEDHAEGVLAFVQKRRPQFKGK